MTHKEKMLRRAVEGIILLSLCGCASEPICFKTEKSFRMTGTEWVPIEECYHKDGSMTWRKATAEKEKGEYF